VEKEGVLEIRNGPEEEGLRRAQGWSRANSEPSRSGLYL